MRMKVIAENIANASSTSPTPGGDPYRRKISTVTSNFDRELEAPIWWKAAAPSRTEKANSRSQYDPGNPAMPDKQGYVKLPNVDPLVEIMDIARGATVSTRPI